MTSINTAWQIVTAMEMAAGGLSQVSNSMVVDCLFGQYNNNGQDPWVILETYVGHVAHQFDFTYREERQYKFLLWNMYWNVIQSRWIGVHDYPIIPTKLWE